MNGYVITVDFQLKPGAMEAFRELIDANAIASFAEEPGCQRFDVLVPRGSADRIYLYEIYDDRAAFEAHLKTAHFAAFNRQSEALVLSKQVAEYDIVCEASEF